MGRHLPRVRPLRPYSALQLLGAYTGPLYYDRHGLIDSTIACNPMARSRKLLEVRRLRAGVLYNPAIWDSIHAPPFIPVSSLGITPRDRDATNTPPLE